MASRQEIAAVYAAAVIQGIVLVTFPAVAPIFRDATHYGLSTTEYGGMFTPQAVTAIVSSLLGAGLTRRIGGKSVFLIGLTADLLSMILLFVSQFATGTHPLAYGLLLAATGCLGIGFGFVVPSLNTFTAAFFPQKVDQSILTLNALLGTGTALAPIFAAIFVGLGFWWGLPVLMIGLTVALMVFGVRLQLKDGEDKTSAASCPATQDPDNKLSGLLETGAVVGGTTSRSSADRQEPVPPEGSRNQSKIPARFWVYAAFALLYGVCETMSGNWATVYMSSELGASTTLASMALTVFWVAVTGGRVLFAVIEKWVPERWTYRGLPLVMVAAFLATAAVPKDAPVVGILAFGVAGLGCSALLPLVISFGQGELKTIAASVAGGMIGFYQMGYGIAAFGVGPLQASAGLNLAEIYRGSAVVAVILAGLAFVIVGRKAESKTGNF